MDDSVDDAVAVEGVVELAREEGAFVPVKFVEYVRVLGPLPKWVSQWEETHFAAAPCTPVTYFLSALLLLAVDWQTTVDNSNRVSRFSSRAR